MSSIDASFLKLLKNSSDEKGEVTIIQQYPIFVETGTYLGETTFEMEKLNFKELHTIEVQPAIYHKTKSSYKGNKVKFYLGDSSHMLKLICSDLKENTVFFLDGHYSSDETGKGEKDCPLFEELENIMTKFAHKAIIIIDDVRLFGEGPNKGTLDEDWEDISKEKILDIVKSRLTDSYDLPSRLCDHDRLILHLSQK